ncbi:MAG: Coenzyme F420 hydrogenase/dehydrogenase, beta subunit C-terminal domain [Oscillospiraceae bacterium]|nr:Coenzyme F420 hydrogenase/dehydrogenase, beta subunit C-terminal domain [Oscillospiraceae bacterium]
MRTVCDKDKCSGCMACVNVCGKEAIAIKDSLSCYNAVIDETLCVNCGACERVCQENNRPDLIQPLYWYQGWAEDAAVRKGSVSGGVAQAIQRGFIDMGGVVISCAFDNGEFAFKAAETIEELKQFAGSKYVKSNPKRLYKRTVDYLRNGIKVLFVGLPCQVAAVKNYVPKILTDDLYTADLICHGTPSPQILDMYLKQYVVSLKHVNNINFRAKSRFQIVEDLKPIESVFGICDHYSTAFLNAICYTENCYSCAYARKERIGDLSLGDSWGSNQEQFEINKGISLILCQNDKGMDLLKNGKIHLENVDIKNAVAHNHQLREPMSKPRSRDAFFAGLKNGKKFNSIVRHCYPWICAKQFVKKYLIKARILRGGG